MIRCFAPCDDIFRAWPNLLRLHLPSTELSTYTRRLRPPVPNVHFSHLSLRITSDAQRDQAQHIVATTIDTLTHLNIDIIFRELDLAPIFTTSPVHLRHLTLISSFNSSGPSPNSLDIIFHSLVNLTGLTTGLVGIKDFSFLAKLPRLKDFAICLRHWFGARGTPTRLLDHLSALIDDLNSRLISKHQLNSVTLKASEHIQHALGIQLDQLRATCDKLEIAFVICVEVFEFD